MKKTIFLLLFLTISLQLFSYKIETNLFNPKKPSFLDVDFKRTKTFTLPNEKISKWIYFKDSNKLNKFYGSILVKSKGEEGIALFLIRVWDGKKYYFKRMRRSKIKSGTTIFSMKTKNGLEYTVKCPKTSYTQKTLTAEIHGKVISPDFM